jgi:hypothetical protein
MPATMSAPASREGRTFAQLPINKPFQDICNHVHALYGACLTQFSAADGPGRGPYFVFLYQGERFRGEEILGRLHLSVEGAQCPERSVFNVLNHFSWMLASPDGE